MMFNIGIAVTSVIVVLTTVGTQRHSGSIMIAAFTHGISVIIEACCGINYCQTLIFGSYFILEVQVKSAKI